MIDRRQTLLVLLLALALSPAGPLPQGTPGPDTLQAQDASNLPSPPPLLPTGAFGGRPRAIAAADGIAFAAVGQRIQSIDLSDPASPAEIGWSPGLGGPIVDLKITGQFLYAVVLRKGVVAFDISDQGYLHRRAWLELDWRPVTGDSVEGSGLEVDGSRGWLLVDGEGLICFEMRGPGLMHRDTCWRPESWTWLTGETAIAPLLTIARYDRWLYVSVAEPRGADWHSRLHVLEIGDEAITPRTVFEGSRHEWSIYHMQVAGDLLLAGDRVMELSEPDQPRLASTIEGIAHTPRFTYASSLITFTPRRANADGPSGSRIERFDLSDPTAPRSLGSHDLDHSIEAAAATDHLLLFLAEDSLQLYRDEDTGLSTLGSLARPADRFGLLASLAPDLLATISAGNELLLAEHHQDTAFIPHSRLAIPFEIRSIVPMDDDRLVVSSLDGHYMVVDHEDPSRARVLAQGQVTGPTWWWSPNPPYIYGLAERDGERASLVTYQLATDATITLIAEHPLAPNDDLQGLGLLVYGSQLHIVTGGPRLWTFDLSEPTAPRLERDVELGSRTGVYAGASGRLARSGSNLFIAAGDSVLVIEIDHEGRFEPMGVLPVPIELGDVSQPPTALIVQGTRLLAIQQDILWSFDIVSGWRPEWWPRRRYPLAGFASSLLPTPYGLISNPDGGLQQHTLARDRLYLPSTDR